MHLRLYITDINGRHQSWWFLLFDILDFFGVNLIINGKGNPVKIHDFTFNFDRLKPNTMKYNFALMVWEMQ